MYTAHRIARGGNYTNGLPRVPHLARPAPQKWYELNWPANLPAKAVTAWLDALSTDSTSHGTRFVMVATKDGIRHYLVLSARRATTQLAVLKTFITDLDFTKVEPRKLSPQLVANVLTSSTEKTLLSKKPEQVSYTILSNLTDLYRGESIIMSWTLGVRRSPGSLPAPRPVFYSPSWSLLLDALTKGAPPPDAAAKKSLAAKRELPGWRTTLYIGVRAYTPERRHELLERTGGALRSSEAAGVRVGLRLIRAKVFQPAYIPWHWPLSCNTAELTGLLGWPLGSKDLPGIQRALSRRLAPSNRMPKTGHVIATHTSTKGTHVPLTLRPKDALMHTHVLGPTGVGKTTLLLNLIHQDLNDGHGVVVIDPKGDLITDVLRSMPKKRYGDVVILDPSDESRPVGLNPLSHYQQPSSLVVDDMLSIFRHLYSDYFGPRTEDILHAGLLTLTSVPGASLCTLPFLYTSAVFRHSVISASHNPLGLDSFWSWFDNISERERSAVLSPVMNKLRAFLLRPAMWQMIGQAEPKLHLDEAINNQKVLLVNLSKGLLGSETSQLFGALVISQLWQAIQTRASLPAHERKPVFVYIDETQDYLHLPTDIGDFLSQSRSYGVGLTLAHQHLNQLGTDLRAGVLANARNRICFQLDHHDAAIMAKTGHGLEPVDFENLSRYQVYTRLVGHGAVLPWASGVTNPPPKFHDEQAAQLRARSRARYGRDAADVEAAISQQLLGHMPLPPQTDSKSIGRIVRKSATS